MKLFYLLLVLSCSLQLYAETQIYVSPLGNDSNSGTCSQPLATLEGARDRIRILRSKYALTDTIFVEIQSGTYSITHAFQLNEKDSGTPQAPVIFRGNSTNRPLLCGGRETSRFEEVESGLWRVYIPEVVDFGFYFEQLYVNGERRLRAQTPNGDQLLPLKRVEELPIDTSGQRMNAYAAQKVVFTAEHLHLLKELEQNEWNDVLISFYHKWEYTPRYVQQVNVNDSALYVTGNGLFVFNPLNQQTQIKMENYRKALDQPGEWLLQRDGYLYYKPLPGETIEKTRCVYPVSDRLIEIAGKRGSEVSYIQFQNIRFESEANRIPMRKYKSQQSAAEEDAAIRLDHATHIEFLNCDIAHTGHHGIWFRENCSYSKMEHCHLYDLGCGGVKIGCYTSEFRLLDEEGFADTHHITIYNNIIQHGGYLYPNSTGVAIFYASDNTVLHNDIADFRYTGISVGWVWGYAFSPSKRNHIAFNHIHHLGWGQLSDMGGVYTLGASEGTYVTNNIIHHIHAFSYGGWGLYTDEGSSGVCMENNLVYKCKNAAFHQHYGKENMIRNNIFAFNRYAQMQLTRFEKHRSFTFTNNIVYYDKGVLYYNKVDSAWFKAETLLDYNCFWNSSNRESQEILGLDFSVWKKLGKDRHSIWADPLFVDPIHLDFRFRSTRIARKIGFKPFDYTQAGVCGDVEWKEKAKLSTQLEEQFDRVIEIVK